jgi:hypothetical protein
MSSINNTTPTASSDNAPTAAPAATAPSVNASNSKQAESPAKKKQQIVNLVMPSYANAPSISHHHISNIFNTADKAGELTAMPDMDNKFITNADFEFRLDKLKGGGRVLIYRQQRNTDTKYWYASILKPGSNKKHGQSLIHFDGKKRTSSEWVTRDEIASIIDLKDNEIASEIEQEHSISTVATQNSSFVSSRGPPTICHRLDLVPKKNDVIG